MVRFEHRHLLVNGQRLPQDTIDVMSERGWELVSVLPPFGGYTDSYWKRPARRKLAGEA